MYLTPIPSYGSRMQVMRSYLPKDMLNEVERNFQDAIQ